MAEIGIIGLATMGANLSRNIASKGFKISVFNRTLERTDKFIAEFGGQNLIGTKSLEEFVAGLEKPRKIILMVQAGAPVDEVIAHLKPLLEKGDLIVDGGNSYYEDTERRMEKLAGDGIMFLGMGISGGEEGALHGPSLMPGGDVKAYENLKSILEKIGARDFDDRACVTYVGAGSAGHYVKMVHNGIEYAIMQLLAETYDILRKANALENAEMADLFRNWDKSELNSYLMEIVAKVVEKNDEMGDGYLVEKIKDQAGQKGTGGWTAIEGLKRGVALPQITAAVQARITSSQKKARVNLAKIYSDVSVKQKKIPVGALKASLFLAIILAYAEGFSLISSANAENNWGVKMSEICRIWEGGCIIRSKLLSQLRIVFDENQGLENILGAGEIKSKVLENLESLIAVNQIAIGNGIAVPCFSAALNYLQSMTNEKSPANLIQGLRDFFGAHTYERHDLSGIFHTNW